MRKFICVVVLGIFALVSVWLIAAADGVQPPPATYRIHVQVQGQGTLTVDKASITGKQTFPSGTEMYVYYSSEDTPLVWTANAEDGWRFDHWTLGAVGSTTTSTNNPESLTLANASELEVICVFKENISYTVALSAEPTVGGTVDGDGSYLEGSSATIIANPSNGYKFVNWTEGGTQISTQKSYTFTVTKNRNLVAHFVQASYTLTINIADNGQGTTDPAVGTYSYPAGTTVPLEAIESTVGWHFNHWDGDLSGTTNPTTITMDSDKTVTAVFMQGPTYVLTMAVQPSGAGTTVPAIGQNTYSEGTVVNVSATASAGYQFDHWQGALTGTAASGSVTMTSNKTLTAVFTSAATPRYTLTMIVNGQGTTDPSSGTHTYNQGTQVSIQATPAAGWSFDHWSGAVADQGSSSTTVTMDGDKTVTAYFNQQGTNEKIDDNVESGPDSWIADPLWHITDTKSHSPRHSWWFGDERTGTYASGTYSTQSVQSRTPGAIKPMAATGRVYGSLTSAPLSLSGYGRQARVSFWYWRSVESYLDGSYDRTYVQVQFGGGWQTIWSRDSKDPSRKTWEEVGLLVDVPSGATQMQVRFVFDSVDGLHNDYAGWFVDDIKVGPLEQGTVVVVPPLPDGTVGDPYGPVQFSARGGVAPYTWSSTGEVPGLSFDERTGTIAGTPTTAGDYSLTIVATDAAGSTGTATCTIHISATTTSCTLLTEDFTDPTGWTMTSLWHTASGLGCLTYASLVGDYAYFGKASGCSYDTGAAVKGELHSPAVDIPGDVQNVVIEFDQFRYVESYSQAYDKTWLEVSFDNASWETVWYRDASQMSPEASHVQVVRAVPSGATHMWIRFRFDSVDSFYNDYPGWAIDNVEVLNGACVGSGTLPPPSPPVASMAQPTRRDQVSITSSPNPVTDVHTTTFTVRGANVEAMKIQIFDLSGALVYEEEAPGNQLQWHTDNTSGEYLANGVYLYRALVKASGRWITTSAQAVVILR